jgi:hypothetical protein
MCSVVTKHRGCDNSCVVASITVWELGNFESLMLVALRTHTANTESPFNDLHASNYIKKTNCIHEEMKWRLNSVKACHLLFHNLPFSITSGTTKIIIYTEPYFCVSFMSVFKLVSHTKAQIIK